MNRRLVPDVLAILKLPAVAIAAGIGRHDGELAAVDSNEQNLLLPQLLGIRRRQQPADQAGTGGERRALQHSSARELMFPRIAKWMVHEPGGLRS